MTDPTPDQHEHPGTADAPGRGRDGKFTKTLEGAERDAEAARLRGAGHSFTAIAQRLGYADSSGACKAYRRALAAAPAEAVAELRALESARLDQLLVKLQPGIEDGDTKAISEARKISESRRRLHGLDGAVKVDMNVLTAPGGQLAAALAEAKVRLAAEQAQEANDE